LKAGGAIDEIPYSAYTVTTTGTQAAGNLGNTVPSQIATAATGPSAGAQLSWKANSTSAGNNGSGTFCTPNNAFCNTSWLVGQTLQPYPNYKSATIGNLAYGNQHYNALQMTSQWRIPGGGLLGGAFTWAKTINDTTSQQDYWNHHGDRTVAGVPMRLAINVNYPLPIGHGQRFLNFSGPLNRVVSGWALNDITSFQHGGYLGVTMNTNNQLQQHFGAGTTRANYVPGGYTVINGAQVSCNSNKTVSGSAVSRLSQWFNTGCFQYPGDYTFGNENASDPKLFAQGIDNWDLALLKTTSVTERLNVQFRVETFNTFNRFQAGNPNTQVGNANYGVVTSQANNPRQVQLSLRVNY
jgi:hypothetical protein